VRVATEASTLKEQHAGLLHQHSELAAYAERLEALLLQSMGADPPRLVTNSAETAADTPTLPQALMMSLPVAVPDDNSASIGRCSPVCGLSASHSSTMQSYNQHVGTEQPPAAIHPGRRALAGLPSLPQALAAVLGETRRKIKSSSQQGNIPSTRAAAPYGQQKVNGAVLQKHCDAPDGSRSSSPGVSGGRKVPRGAAGSNARSAAQAAPARSNLATLQVRPDNDSSAAGAARAAEGSDHSPDTNKESLAPDDQYEGLLPSDMMHSTVAVPGLVTGFAGKPPGSKWQHHGSMQPLSPSEVVAGGFTMPNMAVTDFEWQFSLRDLMEATQQQLNAFVSEGVS